MLEKVVLIVSALYCAGIQCIDQRDAESMCAKSVQIALSFLPQESPLSKLVLDYYLK